MRGQLQKTGRLPDKQRAKVRKFCEACWKARAHTANRCCSGKPANEGDHSCLKFAANPGRRISTRPSRQIVRVALHTLYS